MVVIEAPAGQGKTELLRALRADAVASGARVLSATGAELEREFPLGLVLQLLESEVYGATRAAHKLFEGAAHAARPLFEAGEATDALADVSFSRLHGLYWLTANLAEERPLVLTVDDAHWGEVPSVRFVDVLSRRLDGLPILLAVAARPSEPGVEPALPTGDAAEQRGRRALGRIP